ncbi:MAG: hypothetical protein COC01_03475 [Bacteroidetes bacterium]|nr:MAG: hypothetical protein COC01_03475 [Bacteroidota bacterium]
MILKASTLICMGNKYLVMLFLVLLNFGFSANDKHKRKFTPPGTVEISENLFFDETEIANIHWLEYTYWLKRTCGDTSKDYYSSLPDTSIWLPNYEVYTKHYFDHPAYHFYPMVGISYEQAVEYCKWRTDRVREMLEMKKLRKPKTYIPKQFQYRLPTKKEWEMVANAGYSEKILKWMKRAKSKSSSFATFNCIREDESIDSTYSYSFITAPVKSYWANRYEIFNLLGNVAEMINEKGIAKGGGWTHKLKEIKIENDFIYDKPENWLGFRCVFEIIEE